MDLNVFSMRLRQKNVEKRKGNVLYGPIYIREVHATEKLSAHKTPANCPPPHRYICFTQYGYYVSLPYFSAIKWLHEIIDGPVLSES